MVGVILSRLDLETRQCFIGQLIISGLELILLFCCDGSTKTGGSIVQLCCIIGYSGPSDSVALSDRMLVLFDISIRRNFCRWYDLTYNTCCNIINRYISLLQVKFVCIILLLYYMVTDN